MQRKSSLLEILTFTLWFPKPPNCWDSAEIKAHVLINFTLIVHSRVCYLNFIFDRNVGGEFLLYSVVSFYNIFCSRISASIGFVEGFLHLTILIQSSSSGGNLCFWCQARAKSPRSLSVETLVTGVVRIKRELLVKSWIASKTWIFSRLFTFFHRKKLWKFKFRSQKSLQSLWSAEAQGWFQEKYWDWTRSS